MEKVYQFQKLLTNLKKYKKRFKKIYKNKKSSDPFEVIADTSRLKKFSNFQRSNSSSKIISKIKSVKI